MENTQALMVLMMSIPALVMSVVTAANAKKTNAAWRARREAKAVAKAAAQ